MTYFHGKSTSWKHWFRKPRNAIKLIQWTLWCVVGPLSFAILFLKPLRLFSSYKRVVFGFCIALLASIELLQCRKRLERKESILQQVASHDNTSALDAVRIAAENKWLFDGSLKGAKMWSADLRNAQLFNANFQDVDLLKAGLTGACLGKIDLRGAILWMTKLKNANLMSADLEAADLLQADLQDAKLNGANLTHTSFAEANLQGADLQKAKLYKCDLRRAMLQGTNFMQAELLDVDLAEAIYDRTTIWPLGFRPPDNAICREL